MGQLAIPCVLRVTATVSVFIFLTKLMSKDFQNKWGHMLLYNPSNGNVASWFWDPSKYSGINLIYVL